MIDHMINHKTNLSKFKRNQIILSIFFYYNSMKIKVNNRRGTGKLTNMWKLNNTLMSKRNKNTY